MNKKTLYHKAKKGNMRVWSVWTEGNEIVTEYGDKDGKMQIARVICDGKNLGKANETTPEEQAEKEALALYEHKKKRKYSETEAEADKELILPMLAKTYDPNKHDTEEWIAQPKLNGVRGIAGWEGDSVKIYSRAGIPWNLPDIQKELESLLPKGFMLDGEIYIHGESLQRISKLTKKIRPESVDLQYHVYDVPVVDGERNLPFRERYPEITSLIPNTGQVRSVGSTLLQEGTDIKVLHDEFVKLGYEGMILRDPEGTYQWGYRSSYLLKVKSMMDAEFKVIGFKDGRGKMAGKVIFVCQNDLNEATFDVVPKATMDERAEMFQNGKDYIGKLLTVQFFERTEDGLPHQPVGIGFQIDR